MAKILVVDDKASLRKVLKEALEQHGHEVRAAGGGGEALLALKKERYSLLITDLRMPDIDGLELTREVKARSPETLVIVMTAFGSVETAVEAMRLGASNFLTKPFSLDHLKVVVDKALSLSQLEAENRVLKVQLDESYRFEGVLGASRAMRKIHQMVKRVAASDSAVLLSGESGTGKELVARAIHINSRRAGKPFLKVNCAALAQGVIESELFGHERGSFTGAHTRRLGRFELADGGSLLLDEVGDLPPESQVKLLRVLQEREIERVGGSSPVRVDVRVIGASNRDLLALVKAGRFREDLFFRLNVVPIHLPPLRERREDIELLARHLLARLAAEMKPGAEAVLSEGALKLLKAYAYPGNIRELENILQRALVLAEGALVLAEHLPSELGASPRRLGGDYSRQVGDLERRLLTEALRKHKGSQTAAAKTLGLSRTLLIYKMKKFGIDAGAYRRVKRKAASAQPKRRGGAGKPLK